MNWLRGTVTTIKKAPYLTADECSIPVVLLAALVLWQSSLLVYLASFIGCVAVALIAGEFKKACEKSWAIDLEARDLVWDVRHWTIWLMALARSSCVAAMLGMILVAFAEELAQ
ncbi:hypothetical protein [Kinneretia aquatilis]|uniref:hypothetical protein n=1 Tax=Kinneretia aquatilis TaxID=2070761 RepID=UPI001495375A|nr:hypothetical protein [Paucibacter aquatile]WIV99248.1 hypothetical protein K9V56_007100 [Paucibacter aquatile]